MKQFSLVTQFIFARNYILASLIFPIGLLQAQILPQSPAGAVPQVELRLLEGQAALTPQIEQLRPTYVLKAGDQVLIRAFELDEISERPFRIDGDGFLDLPIIGRVKAADVTVDQLEKTLTESARKYVRQPQVTVTVVQFSGEPVFFVGAFKAPGIYLLAGRRTLVEMMSSMGGLQPTASRRIKVTRRKEYGPIPLPGAVSSSDGNGSIVEITLATLRDNVNPAEDIVLQPFDVVSVEPAEMVYVLGEVNRVGAFDLQDRDSISVTKALVLSGGIGAAGDRRNIWILRPISNTSLRAKVPLDLDRILAGKDNDKPLLPNDILYVPKNTFAAQNVGSLLRVALPTAVGVAALLVNLAH